MTGGRTLVSRLPALGLLVYLIVRMGAGGVGRMPDYETLRRRHLGDAIAQAPQLIERLSWSADRLAAYRLGSLRELIGYAIERSAWHRERLGGVDLARFEEANLRELPSMTKVDLMENFDRIITDQRLSLELINRHLQSVATAGYLLDRYTAISSGG